MNVLVYVILVKIMQNSLKPCNTEHLPVYFQYIAYKAFVAVLL